MNDDDTDRPESGIERERVENNVKREQWIEIGMMIHKPGLHLYNLSRKHTPQVQVNNAAER